jgi:VWFA-related protein
MPVTRLLAVLLLAAVLPPQQQVFRSRADVVTIPASVRSGNRPVPRLAAADFEVRDNGVVQEITTVSAEEVPLDVTLLLDLSVSVDGPLLQRLKTAVTDTARLLRKDDRIRLVVVSQVLHEVFDLQPRDQPMPLDGLVAEGATSLYDGLAAAMMHPSEAGRRQLVVAFTDGRDSTSIVDEATAKEIARLTDAMVDIVVPVGSAPPESAPVGGIRPANGVVDPAVTATTSARVVTGTSVELAARAAALKPWALLGAVPPGLAELVAPTAGQVFTLEPGESISGAFKRLIDDYRAGYILQYVPQGVSASGWHEVTVSVTKSGRYDVRARKGYGGGAE